MELETFKRILRSFTDDPGNVVFQNNRFVVEIFDNVLEGELSEDAGNLYVEEGGDRRPAYAWIMYRMARMDVLARRIVTNVSVVRDFVQPESSVRSSGVEEGSAGKVSGLAAKLLFNLLSEKDVGSTNVIYLTSNAGEGKTTLVNKLAVDIASNFLNGDSNWLLVPIPMGAKTLLSFDDLITAGLMNRLRFPYMYYSAFVELVKLGAIVPAFDGYEEIFVQSETGEALTAFGNMLKQLNSKGKVLISARQAYFETNDLAKSARLYDASGSESMKFINLELKRWSRTQFTEYGNLRGIDGTVKIYEAVAEVLTREHPLLTRAVLVRRLMDVAQSDIGFDEFLKKVSGDRVNYFYEFVNAIVEREAYEKWIDRSGSPHQSLITLEQHHELLAVIAKEMWITNVDMINREVVDILVEMFADSVQLKKTIARQIKEWIQSHPLLAIVKGQKEMVRFDHEEFREFYLGYSLGKMLVDNDVELRGILIKSSLSEQAVNTAKHYISIRHEPTMIIGTLLDLSKKESMASYIKENASTMILSLLDRRENPVPVVIENALITGRTLCGAEIRNAEFTSSILESVSLSGTSLYNVIFKDCKISHLELCEYANMENVLMQNCDLESVHLPGMETGEYNPSEIVRSLNAVGIEVVDEEKVTTQQTLSLSDVEPDEQISMIEKVLRYLMRSTHIAESILKLRLGSNSKMFINDILPDLKRLGVFQELPHSSGDHMLRIRLSMKMGDVYLAIQRSKGSYTLFLNEIKTMPRLKD